jgi:hypothetical protein
LGNLSAFHGDLPDSTLKETFSGQIFGPCQMRIQDEPSHSGQLN